MNAFRRPTERVDENVAGELWFVDCAGVCRTLEAEERLRPRLSVGEEERTRSIREDRARRHWRSAHIALRFLLERWGGEALRRLPFEFSAAGRPNLPRPAPSFNLSHAACKAGDFALIAIARQGPVGIDLQEIAPRLVRGERRERMENYAQRIAKGAALSQDGDRRFVQAWTRIEALAKADGRGIGKTLAEAGLIGGGAVGELCSALLVRDIEVHAMLAAAVAATAAAWPAEFDAARDFAELLECAGA